MRIIFKIAGAELKTLFYAPIAWITLVVYFVIAATRFMTELVDRARGQELFLKNSNVIIDSESSLTYLMVQGSLTNAMLYIFIFVPLLTMGTINREEQSGTMKLLRSSPVRITEIVLGKYLGLILFNLVLMSSLALIFFTSYFTVDNAELYWYFSMLFGLILYSSCLMAIGFFVSSLTNYQVVAGIATFLLFSFLNLMGNIGQQYDFIRDITWFLSPGGRTGSIIQGLITTRDVCYFLLIILLFLGLTAIRLKSKQESRSWKVTFYRNSMLIVVILTLGYLTSRPGYIGYLDVTKDKINTLDSATQSALKELDGSPVTATLYTNLLGNKAEYGFPRSRNQYIWDFWDRYVRFYPNIKWKYVYYYDIREGDSSLYRSYPNRDIHYIARQTAKLNNVDLNDFLKPGEVNKLADLSGEQDLRTVIELEYKGKKTLARFTDGGQDPWPKQPPMSGSFRRLTRSNTPKVFFTTGHYERSPWRFGEREFGAHANAQTSAASIVNNGMDADTLSLLHRDIPAHTSVLVVADPRSKLDTTEQQKILRYLENGGNAFFYAEPGKQQMLNPVLNKLGVNLNNGILVSPGPHREAHKYDLPLNDTGNYMAREKRMQKFQKTGRDRAGASFSGITTISSQETGGFKIEPILTMTGNPETWIENGVYVADSAAPINLPAEGDIQQQEYVLGVRLSRNFNNKVQRIVIMGDADFMSPRYLTGGAVGLGLYSWLVNNEYPVYTEWIKVNDNKLTIGKDTAKVLNYVYLYGIPGLLLLAGTIILIRRKRK
ncbi:MAG: Gldg family protein [Pseudobacter sp.]|uniref:Gldg family protein n=1 Tax=Pseudobacter sp. TaxID=2045420 RepID=UPI003F80354F